MPDRFYGKTWIYWVQAVILGPFGLFAVTFGERFWTGAMTDANGEPRPAAGPSLVIIGSVLLVVCLMAIIHVARRVRPIVRIFRDGIECQIIGETSLDHVPAVPKFVRLAWAILSLQGFGARRVRFAWPQFEAARVGGPWLEQWLALDGSPVDARTGLDGGRILFAQVAFRVPLQAVADALNEFAADPAARGRLAAWPSAALLG